MAENKPILLLAYANDRVDPDNYLRDLVEEVRSIRQVFEDNDVDHYQIEVRPNVTLDDLIRVFDRNEGQIHIFHFAGHAGELQLMLESDHGHPDVAHAQGFNKFLAAQPNLELVFLNGCSTFEQADALVEVGIPSVIATDSDINDRAAFLFANRFYERLSQRKTIKDAFQAAETKAEIKLGGGGFRGVYWPTKDKATVPWKLLGEGEHWRLQWPETSTRQNSILPLMCDRNQQVETFQDSLELILRDKSQVPYFYLVHGKAQDRHRSLVQRLQEVNIRYNSERLFGKDTGVSTYQVRDWPITGDLEMRQRNLKRSIARSSSFPGITGGYWNARQLLNQQRSRQGAIVFQHTIFGDKWDATTSRLIEWYIDEFWDIPTDGSIPQFIIFLNIVYPEQQGSALSRFFSGDPQKNIAKDLKSLSSSFEQKVKMLQELHPITISDVQEWVEEYFPDDLGHVPNSLFDAKNTKELSMEVVENKLKEEVERLHNQKGFYDLWKEA